MRLSLTRLLEVPATDPEDARRKKLLNILLVGVGLLNLLVLLLTALVDLLHLTESTDAITPIYIVGISLLVVTIGIYAVNRFISGPLASMAFLGIWLILLPFSDVPIEVASGRSLFVFTIPIVISSVLLKPYSTFIFASLSSLEISFIAISLHTVPNVPAILGFFLIAIVSWLSARSLEHALYEVVTINRELDQRVIERTQALSEALVRERAQAGRNQAILQGIADGVIVLDHTGKIIMANPAVEPLVNTTAGVMVGQNLDEWLSQAELAQADREAVRHIFMEASAHNGTPKTAWGKKTLAISVAPVRISDGETIGRVAVFHDFTREAEVDRMKSDFLAMVSHELRTPLNSILGYADMLREGVYGKLIDRQASIIERVVANTNKLLMIVNDLLDQAQIEAGRLSFHNRHFRPLELMDYMHGVMDGFVQAKNLKLNIQIADDLPKMLYGDPQRLNQVLINLVNNAVKFTEQGQIQVNLYRVDDKHWAMEVSDTGVGIPAEAQRFIFEPFRQVDMDVTRRPGGIGLGLSIVRRLVSMMQGEICVTSQVGSGSTFTVILPFNIADKEMDINE